MKRYVYLLNRRGREWDGFPIFPLDDQRKQKRGMNHLRGKLKFGMYVVDCRYHPCRITGQDYQDYGFSCESLLNGNPNSCSIVHCGPEPISKDEAYARVAYVKDFGFEEYMKKYYHLTEEGVEHWRESVKTWNFDIGEVRE